MWLPPLPRFLKKRALPHIGPWSPDAFEVDVPMDFRGVIGVERDPGIEEEVFRQEGPIPVFTQVQATAMAWMGAQMWPVRLPSLPHRMRSSRRANRRTAVVAARHVGGGRPQTGAAAGGEGDARLTELVRQKAAEIGLSAIGITHVDPKFTFGPYQGAEVGNRVIVCVMEQNYGATQKAPSHASERAAFATYGILTDAATDLAEYIGGLGYRAVSYDSGGIHAVIPYAVAAGLGQLGLNGQLLTAKAGSRVRLLSMSTDAPLVVDQPKDYGVPKLCDACRACVVRCPSGAIPSTRSDHRGVVKAKINTKRCLPVVGQAGGCAVCMKVCPVQKYGLKAVYDEYDRTGRILGLGTDELEGYVFDGEYYGPGQKPILPADYFAIPGASL